MTPAPNTRHQRVLLRLTRLLCDVVDEGRLGEVFFAPFDVLLSSHDVVEPDLLFVRDAHAEIVTKANVVGAPDLVVEVLSPSSRRLDEVVKQRAYERTGVPEYWVVDPEADTVKVFRRKGEAFGRAELLSAARDEILTSPLFPGLEIPLATLFR